MTHTTYGEVPVKTPPSRETLLREQSDLRQRAEQIEYVLSYIPEGQSDYQRQELQSELQAIVAMASSNAALLDPVQADPELIKRQKLEAESRKIEWEKTRAAHAEPSAEELATRRANAAKRRQILLDQCEREATEQALAMIEKYEKSGLWREAKLQRIEMLQIRRRLEEQYQT